MLQRKGSAIMTSVALMSVVLSSASALTGLAVSAFVTFPGVVGATRPARKSGVQCMSGGGDGGKTALCILAPGFEEMEAVSPIDLLRRAGVEVTTASLTTELTVKGRNGISVLADTDLDSALKLRESYDAVIVPAVPSNGLLKGDARVLSLLNKQMEAGRVVSAICAAPSVLSAAGVLAGKKYTAHFSVEEFVPEMDKTSAVVVDGNLITSQGAGTGTEFGLALIEELVDKKTADEVAASICWKG